MPSGTAPATSGAPMLKRPKFLLICVFAGCVFILYGRVLTGYTTGDPFWQGVNNNGEIGGEVIPPEKTGNVRQYHRKKKGVGASDSKKVHREDPVDTAPTLKPVAGEPFFDAERPSILRIPLPTEEQEQSWRANYQGRSLYPQVSPLTPLTHTERVMQTDHVGVSGHHQVLHNERPHDLEDEHPQFVEFSQTLIEETVCSWSPSEPDTPKPPRTPIPGRHGVVVDNFKYATATFENWYDWSAPIVNLPKVDETDEDKMKLLPNRKGLKQSWLRSRSPHFPFSLKPLESQVEGAILLNNFCLAPGGQIQVMDIQGGYPALETNYPFLSRGNTFSLMVEAPEFYVDRKVLILGSSPLQVGGMAAAVRDAMVLLEEAFPRPEGSPSDGPRDDITTVFTQSHNEGNKHQLFTSLLTTTHLMTSNSSELLAAALQFHGRETAPTLFQPLCFKEGLFVDTLAERVSSSRINGIFARRLRQCFEQSGAAMTKRTARPALLAEDGAVTVPGSSRLIKSVMRRLVLQGRMVEAEVNSRDTSRRLASLPLAKTNPQHEKTVLFLVDAKTVEFANMPQVLRFMQNAGSQGKWNTLYWDLYRNVSSTRGLLDLYEACRRADIIVAPSRSGAWTMVPLLLRPGAIAVEFGTPSFSGRKRVEGIHPDLDRSKTREALASRKIHHIYVSLPDRFLRLDGTLYLPTCLLPGMLDAARCVLAKDGAKKMCQLPDTEQVLTDHGNQILSAEVETAVMTTTTMRDLLSSRTSKKNRWLASLLTNAKHISKHLLLVDNKTDATAIPLGKAIDETGNVLLAVSGEFQTPAHHKDKIRVLRRLLGRGTNLHVLSEGASNMPSKAEMDGVMVASASPQSATSSEADLSVHAAPMPHWCQLSLAQCSRDYSIIFTDSGVDSNPDFVTLFPAAATGKSDAENEATANEATSSQESLLRAGGKVVSVSLPAPLSSAPTSSMWLALSLDGTYMHSHPKLGVRHERSTDPIQEFEASVDVKNQVADLSAHAKKERQEERKRRMIRKDFPSFPALGATQRKKDSNDFKEQEDLDDEGAKLPYRSPRCSKDWDCNVKNRCMSNEEGYCYDSPHPTTIPFEYKPKPGYRIPLGGTATDELVCSWTTEDPVEVPDLPTDDSGSRAQVDVFKRLTGSPFQRWYDWDAPIKKVDADDKFVMRTSQDNEQRLFKLHNFCVRAGGRLSGFQPQLAPFQAGDEVRSVVHAGEAVILKPLEAFFEAVETLTEKPKWYVDRKIAIMPMIARGDNPGHALQRLGGFIANIERAFPNDKYTNISEARDDVTAMYLSVNNADPLITYGPKCGPDGKICGWNDYAYKQYTTLVTTTHFITHTVASGLDGLPGVSEAKQRTGIYNQPICFKEAVVYQACHYDDCDKTFLDVERDRDIFSLYYRRRAEIQVRLARLLRSCAAVSHLERSSINRRNPTVLYSYRNKRRGLQYRPLILERIAQDVESRGAKLVVSEMAGQGILELIPLYSSLDMIVAAYGAGFFFGILMPPGALALEWNFKTAAVSHQIGLDENWFTDYGSAMSTGRGHHYVISLPDYVARRPKREIAVPVSLLREGMRSALCLLQLTEARFVTLCNVVSEATVKTHMKGSLKDAFGYTLRRAIRTTVPLSVVPQVPRLRLLHMHSNVIAKHVFPKARGWYSGNVLLVYHAKTFNQQAVELEVKFLLSHVSQWSSINIMVDEVSAAGGDGEAEQDRGEGTVLPQINSTALEEKGAVWCGDMTQLEEIRACLTSAFVVVIVDEAALQTRPVLRTFLPRIITADTTIVETSQKESS